MLLKGLNAIVTGANQGLGYSIAEEFLRQGASVIICARNIETLREAAVKLGKLAKPDQKLIALRCDVSKEDEVMELVGKSIQEFKKIDIVVNNAGVYGPKGKIEDVNSEEWTKAVEINLFSIFFLCKHVLPHMKTNKKGKIINISGGGATAPLPMISAYAASKAAVVRLTETLAHECVGSFIDINAVAPGALNTRLLDEILEAGPDKVGMSFYEKALKQKNEGGTPLDKGASLCAYLASSKSDGITGRLLSAVWDPWEDLEKHLDEIKGSDIYTLRRIVPAERSKSWGNK